MNVDYPFRQWLPDLTDLNNPGLVEAKNVFSTSAGYGPVNGLESLLGLSSQISDSAAIIGAYIAPDGLIYVAFSEGSYKLKYINSGGTVSIGSTWTDSAAENVNRISTTDGTENNHFSATNFDTAVYIATGDNGLYRSNTHATPVAAVSGAPSPFFNVANINDFLLGSSGTTLYWSAFNDPDDWTISQRTQAGQATINREDLGEITAIVGGRVPLIFQERGISRLTYVGVPKVWDVRLISDGVGASAMNTVIQVKGLTYFLFGAKLYVTDGATVENLSHGSVEDWAASPDDAIPLLTRLAGETSSSYAYYSPIYQQADNTIIFPPPAFYQNFETTASSGGVNVNIHLAYNIETRQFTYFEQPNAVPVGGLQHPSAVQNYIYRDGTSWARGRQNGDALEATLTTGHITSPGERVSASSVEVHYSGSGATVALSGKDRYGAASDFGSYATPDATTGFASVRAAGRALAASVKIPSGSTWDDLSGLTVNLNTRGQR